MLEYHDAITRFWDELTARPSGPMAFRFLLQPVMAGVLAIRDGFKDAREGRGPYFWTIIRDPARRWPRLREGVKAVSRVIALGVVMEAVYQYVVLRGFRPLEMVNIVLLLAFIPYLLVRGPAGRLARYWVHRRPARPGDRA